MNLIALLRSLEALINEIALWILLVPKTFIQTLLKPHKVLNYCRKEFEKPAPQQFTEYMSPALFWLLVGVLPFFIYLSRFPHSILTYGGTSMQGEIIFMAFFLISPPLSFAWQFLSERKQKIEREELFKSLSYQYYFFGVFSSIFPLIFFLGDLNVDPAVTGILGLSSIAWLLYAEYKFAKSSAFKINPIRFIIFSLLKAALCIALLVLIINAIHSGHYAVKKL